MRVTETLEFADLTVQEVRAILKRDRAAARAISDLWFAAAGVPPEVGDNHWLKNYAEQHVLMPALVRAVMQWIKVNGIPSNATPPVQG